MKYIDAERLKAEIERLSAEHSSRYGMDEAAIVLDKLEDFITSLQQEQPEGNLEYWLEHFGMPEENIDNCITQIAQGYGACRYLEGVQHGAEAVNELAQQEHPSLPSNLDEAANRQAALEQPYKWEEEQDGSFGVTPLFVMSNIRSAFKAAVEWMAGQGISLECLIDYKSGALVGINSVPTQETLKDYCNKIGASRVIVQIRKK